MESADSLLITMAEREYQTYLGDKESDYQTYEAFLKDELPDFVTQTNDLL